MIFGAFTVALIAMGYWQIGCFNLAVWLCTHFRRSKSQKVIDFDYSPPNILKCVSDLDQGKGAFITELWREYRKLHLPANVSGMQAFKFDENLTKLYRAGKIYARDDFCKWSVTKYPGY
jgi:hypothetical protein